MVAEDESGGNLFNSSNICCVVKAQSEFTFFGKCLAPQAAPNANPTANPTASISILSLNTFTPAIRPPCAFAFVFPSVAAMPFDISL